MNNALVKKEEFRWSFRKKGTQVLNICKHMLLVYGFAALMTGAATEAQANPTGGTVVSNAVTMAIGTAAGTTCSDPTNALEGPLVAGKTVGLIAPYRVTYNVDVVVPTPVNDSGDYLINALLKPSASPYFFFSLVSLPPPGTCTVYAVDGNLALNVTPPGVATAGQYLDGGIPSVGGAGPIVPLSPSDVWPFYNVTLGGNNAAISSSPLVFSPPSPVSVSMPGGKDVGSLSVSVPNPGSFQWTNGTSLTTVNHTQPLTVNWTTSGLSNATMLVGGENFNTPNNVSDRFLCAVNATAGTFTVPTWAMANIPVTPSTETQPYGDVFLYSLPYAAPATFTASGLDSGFALFGTQVVQYVVWQ